MFIVKQNRLKILKLISMDEFFSYFIKKNSQQKEK